MTGEAAALLAEAGPFRRARNFHLYTPGRARTLDLYRGGGRGFAGHRAGHSPVLRNTLALGITFDVQGAWSKRLDVLLASSYPEYLGRLVLPPGFSHPAVEGPWADPALGESGPRELLRPGLEPSGADLVRLVNSDGGLGPEIYLSRSELPAGPPVGDFCAAAGVQGLKLLGDFSRSSRVSWDSWDHPLWTRRGPWICPSASRIDYPALFRHFLKTGLLLSPDPGIPSVLPLSWTEGELRLFLAASEGF